VRNLGGQTSEHESGGIHHKPVTLHFQRLGRKSFHLSEQSDVSDNARPPDGDRKPRIVFDA